MHACVNARMLSVQADESFLPLPPHSHLPLPPLSCARSCSLTVTAQATLTCAARPCHFSSIRRAHPRAPARTQEYADTYARARTCTHICTHVPAHTHSDWLSCTTLMPPSAAPPHPTAARGNTAYHLLANPRMSACAPVPRSLRTELACAGLGQEGCGGVRRREGRGSATWGGGQGEVHQPAFWGPARVGLVFFFENFYHTLSASPFPPARGHALALMRARAPFPAAPSPFAPNPPLPRLPSHLSNPPPAQPPPRPVPRSSTWRKA